ncbi:hypothetical protein [uncultured Clostridium sp.]|uniref:hypothetical protein n=1 Tax=uncultured Clostridium sp. TaxID=59620 RepID=UPI0025CE5652|nr:hypothetical protein [uncultured Clostridium sp.]
MQERTDEKILDYLKDVEERNNRKSIKDGLTKIIGSYYKFEARGFIDGKLKMYIPNIFEEMSEEAKRFKYPSENRPEIIKSNKDGSIAITFKFIDNFLSEENVKFITNMAKLMIKRLNPANIFFDEEVIKVNSKNVGFFDFKSAALDDYLYNLIFILVFEGKTLMGSFSCPYSEYKEWKEVALEMIKTIELTNEDN